MNGVNSIFCSETQLPDSWESNQLVRIFQSNNKFDKLWMGTEALLCIGGNGYVNLRNSIPSSCRQTTDLSFFHNLFLSFLPSGMWNRCQLKAKLKDRILFCVEDWLTFLIYLHLKLKVSTQTQCVIVCTHIHMYACTHVRLYK